MLGLLFISLVFSVGDSISVETRMAQVFPDHTYDGKFARSKGVSRAVLLIHGLRPQLCAELNSLLPKGWASADDSSSKAIFVDWQRSGSLLVTQLSKNADVFSFAYGQNRSIESIAEGQGLARHIRQLKGMGYSDIVLLGHSAGGVLARLFVEDQAASEVTKVIQVCAPNGGAFLAKLTSLAPQGQEAFLKSLTEESRQLCSRKRRDKRIPTGIPFVVVVGRLNKFGDGIVTCGSQWNRELQQQGIPAIDFAAHHFLVMSQETWVKKLAQMVSDKHPRWSEERVRSFRKMIGDEEFSRGDFFAQIQSRSKKAQKDGDVMALIECVYAVAPFDSPPGAREHPAADYVKQASEISLAKNDRQDARRFLETIGPFQAFLGRERNDKVTTLACGKTADEILKGEVVASLGPITKAGPDFFDPEVVTRGEDRDIALALGQAIVLVVRPTARIDRLASYMIGAKKKSETPLKIEIDFSGESARYRASMTLILSYEKNRGRIVSVSYQDDWLAPWERKRLDEFKNRFNGKR